MQNNNNKLVRDPVCGMWIKSEAAAEVMGYKNDKFYFCSPACKKSFHANPDYYLQNNLPGYKEQK